MNGAPNKSENGRAHDSNSQLFSEEDAPEDDVIIQEETNDDGAEAHEDEEEGDVVENTEETRKLDWDAIRQHDETREHVQQYFKAKDRREQAQDRFTTMLEEIHTAYSKCIDSILEAAGQVHQEKRQDAMDTMETDLLQLFVGNDRLRTQMQRDLERSSQQWQNSLLTLMASLHGNVSAGGAAGATATTATMVSWILNTSTRFVRGCWRDPQQQQLKAHPIDTLPVVESSQQGSGMSLSADATGATDGTNPALEEEAASEEPDWNGMMQRHPPAAECIRRYLTSRERLEEVDDTFATALDEIHVALKNNIGVLMDTACRIHDDQTQALDAMEEQLLDHFDYNHQQRVWMQQTLEESAQKAQHYFTNLLSSLQHQEEPQEISQAHLQQEQQRVAMPVEGVNRAW
jgi:hypothetical protein